MNEENVRIAVVIGTVATIVVSGLSVAKTIKEERKKRSDIRKNGELDIEAIERASKKVQADIKAGKRFGGLHDLVNSLNDEIEFEKIAIRY